MKKNTQAPLLTESEFNAKNAFSTNEVAGLFAYTNVRIHQLTVGKDGAEPFLVTRSNKTAKRRSKVRIPKHQLSKLKRFFETDTLVFKSEAKPVKSATGKKRDHKAERAARKARAAAALAATPVEAPVVEQADPAVESAS